MCDFCASSSMSSFSLKNRMAGTYIPGGGGLDSDIARGRGKTYLARSLRTASGVSAPATRTTTHNVTPTMGLLLSLPFAGVLGTVGSSCLAGLAFCFTSTAGMCSFSFGVVPYRPMPSRNYSLDVLQVLQLQFLHRNPHRLCCTILLQ